MSKDKRYSQQLSAKDAQHDKIVSAKDAQHNKIVSAKDAQHDKIVSDLHQNFIDELRKSNAKVEAAADQLQNLTRYYNYVLDDIKIKHRMNLCKQQILHAQVIERKNETVKKMWSNVEGTREMLWETFNEMSESKRTLRLASPLAKKGGSICGKGYGKLCMLYNKMKESSSLINELKAEINDDQKVISDFSSKVDEYEVIIDCMEQEYEDVCNGHQTKITSMEEYYEEIICKQSPHHVMKHWVKNKDLRGNNIAFPRFSFFLIGQALN